MLLIFRSLPNQTSLASAGRRGDPNHLRNHTVRPATERLVHSAQDASAPILVRGQNSSNQHANRAGQICREFDASAARCTNCSNRPASGGSGRVFLEALITALKNRPHLMAAAHGAG
jgi:hypothetical protein